MKYQNRIMKAWQAHLLTVEDRGRKNALRVADKWLVKMLQANVANPYDGRAYEFANGMTKMYGQRVFGPMWHQVWDVALESTGTLASSAKWLAGDVPHTTAVSY